MDKIDNQPKVSVIIPVYGVEKYIARCARSLFGQTLQNIEYIFINDCTPDNSIKLLCEVLEQYPQRKEQVQIINLPYNMGAAKAREVGIKAAKGEYIIHCDSDDWVMIDAYQKMYDCSNKYGYDILIADYVEHNGEDVIRQVHQELGENPLSTIIGKPVLCSLFNKLVRRSVISNEIYYPTNHMQEDNVLCIQMFYYANSIGYLNEQNPVYAYYINPNSISHEEGEFAHIKRCTQAMANTQIVCRFAKDKGFYKQYEKEFLSLKFNVRGFLMPLMKQNNRYWNRWISCFPELNWRIFELKNISLSLKVIFVMTLLGVYPLINKLLSLKK